MRAYFPECHSDPPLNTYQRAVSESNQFALPIASCESISLSSTPVVVLDFSN